MTETDLDIGCLRDEKDVDDYLELVREVFGTEIGVENLAKRLIRHHPSMTLNDFFVIKHQGRMVSTLNLIPVIWSIGDVRLKVAEMGHVATLPEYRGRGLIRRLAREFHAAVERQGYDLAVIEGIPYFYRQFGYEYAIPLLEETRMRLEEIPDSESSIKIRQFVQEDIASAMKLLEMSQRKFYVHSVRSRAIWEIQEKTCIASDPEPFKGFAMEEDGQLTGYFRVRENPKEKGLLLTEVSEVDQLEAQAIASFLKQYGLGKGFENLSASISYDEPFVQHLTNLGAVRRTPTYAWQIRVTDYLRIFQNLKPLLESRLANSMYRRLTETLNFNFRCFTIRLNVQEGKIIQIQRLETSERSPIGLNPLAFIQLLMGYKNREELELTFPDMRIAVSHKHLVDSLFPKLPSYIHSAY